MDRYAVLVTTPTAPASDPVRVAPGLLAGLGLAGGAGGTLRFGLRRSAARFQADPDLPGDHVSVPAGLAGALCLTGPVETTVFRPGPDEVAVGPLVGLLIARSKLETVLAGGTDLVYCRYARHAAEAGAVLFFFTVDDLDPEAGEVRGYRLRPGGEGLRWEEGRFPVPRVVYDRCFGKAGRAEAARARELAGRLGFTVMNHPIKIAKLETFAVLGRYPELARCLPYTAPLTRESLSEALEAFSDVYLKPNALYKGLGIYRLTRVEGGWLLRHREEWANVSRLLPDPAAVAAAVVHLLEPGAGYLLQEGLNLASYLGCRFDFRIMVQKGGRNRWVVTGRVARIAPVGSIITSPRSGGLVSPADRALRHAFPDRWEEVLDQLEETALELADRVDRELGPCAELGLDMAVLENGAVRLIEVNGKPLRVSLQRLHDPLVSEQIHRHPIHHAASLDLREVAACGG